MKNNGCSLIMKYLKEIKDIVSKNQIKPGEEIKEVGMKNSYFICGNLLLVRAKMRIAHHTNLKKFGYVLMDLKDKDMLCEGCICIEIDLRTQTPPDITVKNNTIGISFAKIYKEKYPFTNIKYKRYIQLNSNPLDFRQKNMIETINNKRCARNKSGIIGIHICNGNWIAQQKYEGRYKTKSFAVNIYGYEEAKKKAENQRLEWEKEILMKIR